MALLRADLDNKRADTSLRCEQRRWEPWKALSTAFIAGIAVTGAAFIAALWIIAHLFHITIQ